MMSPTERLVYMANQIARNFAVNGADSAAAATAEHIASFWDPRMKQQIFDHLARDSGALCPIARAAVGLLLPAIQPADDATDNHR